MLKFIFIGIGVILVAATIAIIMWLIIKNRRLNLWSAEHDLRALGDFLESKAKADEAKKAQTRLLWFAILTTAILVLITTAYFIGARFYFHEHHEHKYIESVKIESTCIKEGTRSYKCKYCDEYYEEPIEVIEHKYEESDRREPTCVQEGFITYTCNMCNDSYNEPIAMVEHEYEESGRQEPTCVQEGFITYTCKICNGSYNEPIKMVEHIYSEKERKEADCTNTGFIKYACTGCGVENVEEIPVNSNHQYKIVSFSETSFWKNGYNHLSCELCGVQGYTLKADFFNWFSVLAIIIFVLSLIIIVSIRVHEGYWDDTVEKPWFWIATIFEVLSISFLLFHFLWVVPNQDECGHWYDKYSDAPFSCELTEVERFDSSYTQNGSITYKDTTSEKEYIEYFDKREIIVADVPQYVARQYLDVYESVNNGSISGATYVPQYSKVTGRLVNTDDKADYYSFTVNVPSNMHFVFTHDADTWSYHWNATIYGTDGETVLNDGYITNKEQVEFSVSDLQVGTYYLKITQATGGNPIMNIFSDANYYITFTPECIEHTSQTQYFTEVPTCMTSGEIVTVCDACGANIFMEQVESLGHKWSEWNVTKESSMLQLGEKDRTCTVCGEIQNKAILAYIWIAIFLIVSLIVLVILHFVFNKYSESYKGKIITTFIYGMIIFATVYFELANYPLFGIITAIICIALLIKPMIDAKKDWEKGWMIFAIVFMILSLTIGGFFATNYIADKSDNTQSAIHTSAEEKS